MVCGSVSVSVCTYFLTQPCPVPAPTTRQSGGRTACMCRRIWDLPAPDSPTKMHAKFSEPPSPRVRGDPPEAVGSTT
ncbi:Uncharacterised protein [Mycobacteroides abscessus subsp. abscessus]|nr:Uncharacterised protein [Mycobacteroides abscessus subsp. abscessus]